MMKISCVPLLLAASLMVACGGDDVAPSASQAAADPTAVATVNGRPISAAQFQAYERRRGGSGQLGREALVSDLVSIELLAQAAERDGMHETDEISGELATHRSGLLAQAAVRARLEANPITDERIEQEYQRFLDEDLGEELHARHILVADEALARDLIAQLDGGADFAELAQANSTDGSAADGGDLGWFDKNMMVEPFGDAAAALEPGRYTAEPVQTRFGFHIILLEDRRRAAAPALDEIREDIVGYLQAQAIEAWVEELRAAATIEINESDD